MPWEIEYQVLEGGDLDIDFMVISPKGVILVDEKRSEEGLHEITATDKGDYQVNKSKIIEKKLKKCSDLFEQPLFTSD